MVNKPLSLGEKLAATFHFYLWTCGWEGTAWGRAGEQGEAAERAASFPGTSSCWLLPRDKELWLETLPLVCGGRGGGCRGEAGRKMGRRPSHWPREGRFPCMSLLTHLHFLYGTSGRKSSQSPHCRSSTPKSLLLMETMTSGSPIPRTFKRRGERTFQKPWGTSWIV